MTGKFIDNLILGIALLVFLFVIAIPMKVWDNEFPLGNGPYKEIIIKPNKSAVQIAQSLVKQNITTDAVALAKWMEHFKIDRTMRPGTYRIMRGTPWEVARQFKRAKPLYFKVTIIPGSRISDLRGNSNGSSTEKSFKIALSEKNNYPKQLRPFLPDSEKGREAFLLPETYYCPGTLPEYIIQQASALWEKKLGDIVGLPVITKARLHDFAVIASLVEKEAMLDNERPIISGVIYNRLESGMPLQIDASVIYAWKLKNRDIKRVTYNDLKIDSPFNTYKYKGLPPEPICIPSLASWKAAVKPQKSTYLYYVAKRDGSHGFSSKYKDHLKMIETIRKGN